MKAGKRYQTRCLIDTGFNVIIPEGEVVTSIAGEEFAKALGTEYRGSRNWLTVTYNNKPCLVRRGLVTPMT
jgi:hypothetical protein